MCSFAFFPSFPFIFHPCSYLPLNSSFSPSFLPLSSRLSFLTQFTIQILLIPQRRTLAFFSLFSPSNKCPDALREICMVPALMNGISLNISHQNRTYHRRACHGIQSIHELTPSLTFLSSTCFQLPLLHFFFSSFSLQELAHSLLLPPPRFQSAFSLIFCHFWAAASGGTGGDKVL